MGRTITVDYYDEGTWNASCSMCGRKRKASDLVRNWQGLYRCPEHNEERQPQDFARGIKEDMGVPWAQTPQILFRYYPGPTFPLRLLPHNIKLTQPLSFLDTEGFSILTTEDGQGLEVERPFIAEVIPLYPSWVIPSTYAWVWKNGGANIMIQNPAGATTGLIALVSPAAGLLQLTVVDSLGRTAVTTANVST